MRRADHRVAVIAALVAGCASCTLDLGTVRFALPTSVFRFDTTSALWLGGPTTLPDVACGAAAECCATMTAVAVDCRRVQFECAQSRCGVGVSLESALPVFLLRAVPDLALLSDGAMAGMQIREVRVRGRGPAADAFTAALQLGVAAVDSTGARSPRATPLATVPAVRIAAGEEVVADVAEDTAAALRGALRLRSDPLYFVLAAQVQVAPGEVVPRGALVAEVDIQLETSVGQ